jgi:hypothetical protein
MIPESVKAEDILRAIEEVERLGVIPSGRDSEKYDLEYNGKLYPPKYIISLANKYANGKELDHSEFGGDKESNNFLQSLGFNIIGKQNGIDGDDFMLLHETSNTGVTPNQWLFIVTDRPEENLTAEQILETRMNDKFWGLNSGTPLRTVLRKDDKVIFSHGAKEFLGTAILDSDSFELTEEEKNLYSHGQDLFTTEFGIKLKDIDIWNEQKSVRQYLHLLSFVKKKEQYPAYFQGGIKRISKEEYNKITNILEPKNMLSFIDLQQEFIGAYSYY